LACEERGRQRFGNVVEDSRPSFVGRLDPLPVLTYAARGARLDFPEHMRVPPDELLVDRARGLFEVALPLLLEEEREEVDLEEEIAQLVEQLVGPIGERGVGDFVRLLDPVRNDCARGLLPVPGTVLAKPLGQLLQLEERVRERQALTSWWWRWCRAAGRS